MHWELSWKELPGVEPWMRGKNVVVSPYQLCGGGVGSDRRIESDGLSGVVHPTDETTIEIVPLSIVSCICCCWRLWTTSVSIFTCYTKTVNYWASAVMTRREELRFASEGGRSSPWEDCLAEPMELFWALIFAMTGFFLLFSMYQSVMVNLWLRLTSMKSNLQKKSTGWNCVRRRSSDV